MSRDSRPDKTMAELRERIDQLGDLPRMEGHYPEISEKVDQIEREIARREQVEDALRDSERRLSTLMSNLPGMAYRCRNDPQWTMQFVSEGCAGLTGYLSEELDENRVISFNDLIHPDDRDGVFNQVQVGLASRKPFQMVYRIRTKSGRQKWVWEQGVGVFSPQGELQCLEGFIADITPLKEAERAREELMRGVEERFKEQHCLYRIMQAIRIQDAPEVIFQEVTFYLPGGWRFPEIARGQIRIGDTTYVSESFEATPWSQTCEISANGVVQGSVDVYYLEPRPLLDEGPFTHEERRLIRSIANVLGRYIERRQANEDLRRSEERFRSLVEATSDWIWEVDAHGVYTYVSPRVKVILGYEPEEILGKTPFDLMTPEEAERLRGEFRDIFQAHQPIVHLENINLRKDGHQVLLETQGMPVFGVDGTFQGYRGIDRDITERKRTDEERLGLEMKIQHTQKLESLGVLAGGIAHDFNNLLMAIVGNADLARMKLPPDDNALKNLDAIVTTAGHAADLCKQMLAYSGKGKFVIEPLDFTTVIAEMTRMLEVSISKKATLTYDFAADLPPIEADASQLRQVAMNLITNASEAIGEAGGVITVRTGAMDCEAGFLRESYLDEHLPAGRYVFLEVSDTGCGMDRQTQSRLFDPFFTTKSTGRGLGLSAVLGIVRSHHGAIKVYSELGHGTLFKVLFPARDGDSSPQRTLMDPNAQSEMTLSGTILLVEDEAPVRDVVSRMLQKIGLSVIEAVDGLECLNIFDERMDEIDCVLLDLTMPRMNGDEAYKEICRRKPGSRVLMSSGYSEQEISRNFAGQSHIWFIQKPYQVMALRRKLQEVLSADSD